jgi:hypothetical protein
VETQGIQGLAAGEWAGANALTSPAGGRGKERLRTALERSAHDPHCLSDGQPFRTRFGGRDLLELVDPARLVADGGGGDGRRPHDVSIAHNMPCGALPWQSGNVPFSSTRRDTAKGHAGLWAGRADGHEVGPSGLQDHRGCR